MRDVRAQVYGAAALVQQHVAALKRSLAEVQAVIDLVLEGAQVDRPDQRGVNHCLLVDHRHECGNLVGHQARLVVRRAAERLQRRPPDMPVRVFDQLQALCQ